MPRRKLSWILAPVLAAAMSACGDVKGGDPGGMGAGRPDAPANEEVPAGEILDVADPGAHQDSTYAGAPGTTGQLRDSVDSMGREGQQRPSER